MDDDADDRHILSDIFEELNYPNEIITFDNGASAYRYLIQEGVHPFIILSDVNMPGLNGIELRRMMVADETYRHKCIPFLLITTSSNKESQESAFELSVTGYFVKPQTYAGLKSIIKVIVAYWQVCYSPHDTEPAIANQ